MPWANCPYDRQLDAVRQLSIGLLDDWNADYRLAEGMLRPEDLLQAWLGYRIDPAEGRIHGFLESDCGLTAEMPSFVLEGHWYPNPLAFATTAAAASGGLRLRALKGNIHGDLHGFNVLVPARQEGGPNYYLIDLALYDDDQFLFYDHAYFELSHLLRVREGASLAAWRMLLDTPRLLKESQKHIGLKAEDLGLIQTVNTWRQGVTDWAERHESHRARLRQHDVTHVEVLREGRDLEVQHETAGAVRRPDLQAGGPGPAPHAAGGNPEAPQGVGGGPRPLPHHG